MDWIWATTHAIWLVLGWLDLPKRQNPYRVAVLVVQTLFALYIFIYWDQWIQRQNRTVMHGMFSSYDTAFDEIRNDAWWLQWKLRLGSVLNCVWIAAAVTLARRTRSRGEWVVVHSDARGIQAELKDRLRKADTLSLVAFVVIICLPVLSWICLGRDPYRVLGVTPLDDMITIRRAFRRLHYQVYHDSGLEYD